MDIDKKLECLKDLLEASFVPSLKSDLDNIPIEREHFEEYHKILTERLPLIYDLVQEQKEQIFENQEIHSLAILLLCELTAPETIFRLNDEQLQKNANRLLQRYLGEELNSQVDKLIFEHYKCKLKTDIWKRELGTIHGFGRYLEFIFCKPQTETAKNLSADWLSFCLAVALTIRDCHENAYKELGIKMFLIILKHAHSRDIRELNIHSVIYESAMKDVHFMEAVVPTENIWNCLYECLNFFPNIDSLNWSQVDDMLEILIRNIPVARNNPTSICMLNFIPKLCIYFTLSRREIEQKCSANLNEFAALDECRQSCVGNSSYSCFRWAKSILELIMFESYKLMNNSNTCIEVLETIHKCYMVCILPISLKIIEVHLINFLEKFTAVLMEAIRSHNNQEDVVQQVKIIIDTFLWQLRRSIDCEHDKRLSELLQALEKLKQHHIFK